METIIARLSTCLKKPKDEVDNVNRGSTTLMMIIGMINMEGLRQCFIKESSRTVCVLSETLSIALYNG